MDLELKLEVKKYFFIDLLCWPEFVPQITGAAFPELVTEKVSVRHCPQASTVVMVAAVTAPGPAITNV